MEKDVNGMDQKASIPLPFITTNYLTNPVFSHPPAGLKI